MGTVGLVVVPVNAMLAQLIYLIYYIDASC